MNKFILDRQYSDLLGSVGINITEVLQKAQLPEELFSHKTPSISSTEYFRFMEAVGSLAPDDETSVKIGLTENIETFSPPIFAAYCSKNACSCIERLARYKKLIGPMVFITCKSDSVFTLEITTENEMEDMPGFLVETEFVIIINLIRRATKEHIIPLNLMTRYSVTNNAVKQYWGLIPEVGDKNMLTFSLADVEKPFISRNDTMWNYLEPELIRRLSEKNADDSFSAMVRSALIELLPSGESGIEQVAKRLAVSKRTLQRKLWEEKTTFQKQLNNTRELLSKYYIKNTEMTNNDIAYLLGYQDLNSFLRAFNLWTGMNISEYKTRF